MICCICIEIYGSIFDLNTGVGICKRDTWWFTTHPLQLIFASPKIATSDDCWKKPAGYGAHGPKTRKSEPIKVALQTPGRSLVRVAYFKRYIAVVEKGVKENRKFPRQVAFHYNRGRSRRALV